MNFLKNLQRKTFRGVVKKSVKSVKIKCLENEALYGKKKLHPLIRIILRQPS